MPFSRARLTKAVFDFIFVIMKASAYGFLALFRKKKTSGRENAKKKKTIKV